MLGITQFWTYVFGTMIIIMLPGPNSMYVLSTAARRGVPAGYAAACGVFLGDAVIMTLSAAGVASLLKAEPLLFDIVKYAGAGYLCFIGYGLLRGVWRSRHPTPASGVAAGGVAAGEVTAGVTAGEVTAGVAPGEVTAGVEVAGPVGADERSPFRRALGISLLNPKAILFFISFFIQFVDPSYPYPALSFLILGTIAEIFSFIYLTTLIFAGSYLASQFRRRHRLAQGLTTGVAAIFVGFAVKLATASLN